MYADDFDADIGRRPQVEAPAIAALSQLMAERPAWQATEPFETDPVTFERARDEMAAIQRNQGRPLPVAPWIARPNFLIRGVPVVSNAED